MAQHIKLKQVLQTHFTAVMGNLVGFPLYIIPRNYVQQTSVVLSITSNMPVTTAQVIYQSGE